jgi:hypothetical protein
MPFDRGGKAVAMGSMPRKSGSERLSNFSASFGIQAA